ncbi:MAG TPA: NADH-ubiquinone oxidoreductase-F iron-sulfur binding region domain-containing protein [Candidatus Dormibacteraeota bacterium]
MTAPVRIRRTAPARLLPATPAPEGITAHLATFGERPPLGAALIDELERSGLAGRGGAGFPAGRKWRAVASHAQRAWAAVVVADAVETEPASIKDQTLLALRPHLVLDGIQHAVEAVGATRAVLYVSRANASLVSALSAAIAERPPGEVTVELRAAPMRYVAGEETAVVNRLNGRAARPSVVPPRPYEAGVDGHPTLLHNVETLAHTALVARRGAAWFRSVGTADSPGTALVTVCGAVGAPGVHEVSLDMTIGETVDAAGGAGAEPLAVLVGGYFGTWLHAAEAWPLGLNRLALARAGAGLGAGVIAVLPRSACGVAETDRIITFLARESAGQCGPCHMGLPAVSELLHAVALGRAGLRSVATLRRWAGEIYGRGACRHPDGAVLLLRSALAVFGDDLERHARGHPCGASRHAPILPTPALPAGWR